MTDPAEHRGQDDARRRRERARRLARVFGEVLPDSTDDDRDDPGERADDARRRDDAWLRDQVPPHHGTD